MTDLTFLESTTLTFDTIPSGSQSTAQEVEVVNPLNVSGAAIDSDQMFFGGYRIQIAATTGTLTVRAFDGDPAVAGVEIYRADYEYTVANETLSDRLGADMVPCYDSIYATLEGSVVGMTATVGTYVLQGKLKAVV